MSGRLPDLRDWGRYRLPPRRVCGFLLLTNSGGSSITTGGTIDFTSNTGTGRAWSKGQWIVERVRWETSQTPTPNVTPATFSLKAGSRQTEPIKLGAVFVTYQDVGFELPEDWDGQLQVVPESWGTTSATDAAFVIVEAINLTEELRKWRAIAGEAC